MYNSHKGVYFMKLYKRVLTVVAAASLLGAALCGCGGQNAGGASQPADSSSSDTGSSSSPASSQAGSVGKADDVSIKKGEWTDIEWETYVDQTGFFSLEMPKGWKIDVTDMYGAGRVAGLQINVCNPEDTVGTDMVDFGTAAIADMTDATVESLFRDALYKSLPNFTIKESKTAEWQQHFIDDNPDVVLDAKVIRADYTDKTKGDDREVMCQAVLEKGLLDGYYGYVTAYAAYSVRGELDNWIDTLARIQTSFKVTDAYQARFKSSGGSGSYSGTGGSASAYDAGDAMMESWEARNRSEDIISQKQSDVTLGYERVYDTETGEIYKAESGFMDWYELNDGQRYASCTDDMYTEGYSGWIEFN